MLKQHVFDVDRKMYTRLAVAVGLIALVLAIASPAYAAGLTFLVNSTGDTSDAAPGNGQCKDIAGKCTLRAAIEEAEAHVGKDIIKFSPAALTTETGHGKPWVFSLGTAFPDITKPVVIDGVANTGANCSASTLSIVLDGSALVAGEGLHITGGASTVKGLVIRSFPDNAVHLENLGGNIITCNIIGLDVDGTTAAGNNGIGIYLQKSPNNTIGGTTAGLRNIIAANNNDGIKLLGATTTGNKIYGNRIGVDKTGLVGRGNNGDGIILISGASSNFIGGNGTAYGNLIAANIGQGVNVNDVSHNNKVQGNVIGLDSAGTGDLGNGIAGISVVDANNTLIGGTSAGMRNVVSGNLIGISVTGSTSGSNNTLIQGNYIGTNRAGTSSVPNNNEGIVVFWGSSTVIGGVVVAARNIVSGNGAIGIELDAQATSTLVQGNYVGLNAAGGALGNSQQGIYVNGSGTNTVGNTVGGSAKGARNVISNNGSDGIQVVSESNVTISGNMIGLNVAGTAAMPNGGSGVFLDHCTTCLIGGTANVYQRNIISGNASYGIRSQLGDHVSILGNYVGTDITGKLDFGNGSDGIELAWDTSDAVGDAGLGRNVVAGNTGDGIHLDQSSGSQSVLNNYVGVDVTGTKSIPNSNGISVDATTGSAQIGIPGKGNLISGNNYAGLFLANGSTSAAAQGNIIGLNGAGTAAVANGGSGIIVGGGVTGTSNAVIGGTNLGEGNVISGNGSFGISICATCSGTNIKGNIVGLNAAGTAPLGNGGGGLSISGDSTVVGGNFSGGNCSSVGALGANACNIISGNQGYGIYVDDAAAVDIKGNNLGTDVAGSKAFGNQSNISFNIGSGTVGGSTAGDGNVIVAAQSDGIYLNNAPGPLIIQRNWIGTDRTGRYALGNHLYAIESYASTGLQIQQNVIAYNGYGIYHQNVPFAANSDNNCLFYNTSQQGLIYYGYTGFSTPFNGNWWGDSSGPAAGYDTVNPGHQYILNGTPPFIATDGSYLSTPPSGINCPVGTERLLNGTFEAGTTIPTSWTAKYFTAGEGLSQDDVLASGTYSLKMLGGGGATQVIQARTFSSPAGYPILFSVWTKGIGVSGTGSYTAQITLTYVGGSTQTFSVPVTPDGFWDHVTKIITPTKNVTKVTVKLLFTKTGGTVYWDDASLQSVTVTP